MSTLFKLGLERKLKTTENWQCEGKPDKYSREQLTKSQFDTHTSTCVVMWAHPMGVFFLLFQLEKEKKNNKLFDIANKTQSSELAK